MNVTCDEGTKTAGWPAAGYPCGIAVIAPLGCIRTIPPCAPGYMYWGCCGMNMTC